ncbi:MAG: LPS export ABC transporter periplasmic protein LptC [Treponema sp.]|nr:LPS export ABC transporter periplasmic protein LptC [Treponema sp.]
MKYALPLFCLLFCFLACSFDYGDTGDLENERPDLVMNDVEYVRVRKGDPQVRFMAELVERYEDKQIVDLKNFSFEQFDRRGEEINARGRAGTAEVELESGNVELGDGVQISVQSEDFTVETGRLHWHDKDRVLSGNPEDEVRILRENGTSFSGWGFSANARSRTWGFEGGLSGTYIHDDDEEEEEEGDLVNSEEEIVNEEELEEELNEEEAEEPGEGTEVSFEE